MCKRAFSWWANQDELLKCTTMQQQTRAFLFLVTQHFVGQFRNKNETYYLEEENKQSLYIFRSSDQPEKSINEFRTDKLLMPGMKNGPV